VGTLFEKVHIRLKSCNSILGLYPPLHIVNMLQKTWSGSYNHSSCISRLAITQGRQHSIIDGNSLDIQSSLVCIKLPQTHLPNFNIQVCVILTFVIMCTNH
jgi:hypothetical protein